MQVYKLPQFWQVERCSISSGCQVSLKLLASWLAIIYSHWDQTCIVFVYSWCDSKVSVLCGLMVWIHLLWLFFSWENGIAVLRLCWSTSWQHSGALMIPCLGSVSDLLWHSAGIYHTVLRHIRGTTAFLCSPLAKLYNSMMFASLPLQQYSCTGPYILLLFFIRTNLTAQNNVGPLATPNSEIL